jgi:hypothetical protein
MGGGMGPCFAKEGREKGGERAGEWAPVRRIGRGGTPPPTGLDGGGDGQDDR